MLVALFSFRSHEVALTKGLLEGYKIHVTKKVKPEPAQMKGMEQSTLPALKFTSQSLKLPDECGFYNFGPYNTIKRCPTYVKL